MMRIQKIKLLKVMLCLLFAALFTLANDDRPLAYRLQGESGPIPSRTPAGWSLVPEQKENQAALNALLNLKRLHIAPIYYETEVYPYWIPTQEQIGQDASVTLARREYEPMMLALYTQITIPALHVRFSKFSDGHGHEFKQSAIDVRKLRFLPSMPGRGAGYSERQYKMVRGPLESVKRLHLPQWQTTFLWLNFYASEDTPAGTYQGTMFFEDEEGNIHGTQKISVTVLPFELPNVDRAYGWYMLATPWSGARRWLRPENYDKLFALWKEYGMESPSLFMEGNTESPGFLDLYYDKDDRLIIDFSQLDRMFNKIIAAGIKGPVCLNTGTVLYGFFKQEANRLNGKHPGKKILPEELYKEFNIRLLEHARANNWPELYLLAGEESTVNLRFFQALREIPGAISVWIDNDHWGPGNRFRSITERWGDRHDVREINYLSKDRTLIAHHAGQKSWFYNQGNMRLTWGFMMDMVDADGYHLWAGEWPDVDPYCPYDRDLYFWMNTFPANAEGVLSTPMFEMAREGIDDSRYVSLCRKLLASLPKDSQLRINGEKEIESLLGSLPQNSEDYWKVVHTLTANPADPLSPTTLRSHCIRLVLELQAGGASTKTVHSSTKESLKTIADGFWKQLGPDKAFSIPPHFKESPDNQVAAGMAGFRCVNTIDGSEFVWVPGTDVVSGSGMENGAFMMGSEDGVSTEKPVHPVQLTGFWIGRYPITVGQFKHFLKETGYNFQEKEYAGVANDPMNSVYMDDARSSAWALDFPDDTPMRRVSHVDAVAYAKWAKCQLPTEARWEYAGRGPAGFVYPWGNQWNDKAVHFVDGKPPRKILSINEYPLNVSWCGSSMMTGVMREWCADRYSAYENFYARSPLLNPVSDGESAVPILRGGSAFYGTPERFRLSGKYYCEWFDVRVEMNGFRLTN